MLRFFISAIVIIFSFTISDVQAQINWDIPETETPDGPGPGSGGDGDFYCMSCCSGGLSDSGCCAACNCQCGGLPNCFAYQAMSSANVPKAVNAHVLNSFAETQDQLVSTKRGKKLYSVLTENALRVAEIFKNDAKLTERTGAALAKYWPHDMWTNTGKKAHKVAPEALKELRDILTHVAAVDEKMGASTVSTAISKEVIPHLGKDIIGQPYHKAFACFVSGQTCSASK